MVLKEDYIQMIAGEFSRQLIEVGAIKSTNLAVLHRALQRTLVVFRDRDVDKELEMMMKDLKDLEIKSNEELEIELQKLFQQRDN